MSEPKPDIPPGAMWRVVSPHHVGMFYRCAAPGHYQVWTKEHPAWTDTSTRWSLAQFDDRGLFEVVA